MKVLVVGSGGREHALVWAIRTSPRLTELYVAPGNGGTALMARNVPIAADAVDELVAFVEEKDIDLTVVGPEAPLVAGLVDRLQAVGRRAFGPSQAAAQLEGSKVFAKEFMQRHGIPTADFKVFEDAPAARAYVDEVGAPIVIKADGLAAGKGVIVAHNTKEAHKAIDAMLLEDRFGDSGHRVIVEQCLQGEEVSAHSICAVDAAVLFPFSQDHKRAFDNDQGPNTGGMGAYAPVPFVSDSDRDYIFNEVIMHSLEKLENQSNPDVQEIPDRFKTEYLQGVDVYATVLAYRNDIYPSKARPPDQGWKDLWDIGGIPGERAMRKHPFDTIEEALIADGVAPGEEYNWLRENGYDRAFSSLDKIKSNINIWWTGGAQTSQLLSTGEVDICPTWNGRAQAAIDGGAPVTISWNEGIFNFEGWSILKGTPRLEEAREFVTFCANAKTQALQSPHISYGPVNPNAYDYIDEDRAKVLSTNPAFLPLMHKADNVFWGKEKDKASELFNTWLIG